MAVVPTIPLVSADEYLKSGYHPDMEYFRRHRKQFHFAALSEARTQIVARARYRIPDLLLCPVPLPAGNIVDSIPRAVIEILSPEDSVSEQLARFRDYKH